MSKTLSNILTVFKVAKIIAKVVFILCIVGVAGCILGLVALPMVDSLQALTDIEVDLPSAYVGCIVGAIVCAGEVVFAFLAGRYFENVLNAGTPFTSEGAKESFRLGIASLIISVATSIIAGIASSVVLLIASAAAVEPDVSASFSISTGLFFLFLSLIFKHGAELRASCAEQTQQEEQKAEIESNGD